MSHEAQDGSNGITLHAVHLGKRSFLKSALALLLTGAGLEVVVATINLDSLIA